MSLNQQLLSGTTYAERHQRYQLLWEKAGKGERGQIAEDTMIDFFRPIFGSYTSEGRMGGRLFGKTKWQT